MRSDDYAFEVRQNGRSFLLRALWPNFVIDYLVSFNGPDALITARYQIHGVEGVARSEGSFTTYHNQSRHVDLCGAEDAGEMVLAPVLGVLDRLRDRLPD